MTFTFRMLLAAAIISLSPLAASGGVVTSVVQATGFPGMGDYAADSFSTAGTGGTGSQLQVADNRNFVGQSFTLGTAGQSSYLFNSITFEIQDQGETNETLDGLTLDIFQGLAGASPTLGSFSFGSGTFDASIGNFVTFELTAAESTTLGPLLAGTEYSAVLAVLNDQAATPAGGQFRIRREATGGNSYAGGNAIFNDAFVANTDAVFQVNVTAVPEPSSLAVICFGGLAMLGRRRRKA